MTNRLCIALFALAVPCSQAEVVRIEITEREIVADGFVFGAGGQYERILGKVHYALDPGGKMNGAIRDLHLAETNDQGRVTFSGTFFLLRPRDSQRSNGTLLLEISNRGTKGMLSRFCYAPPEANPRARGDFGNGWLLEQGYSFGWIGWQGDLPPDPGLLRLEPARLRDPHAPGLVRAEFVPDKDVAQMPLGDRGLPPVPMNKVRRLGVRSTPDEEPRELLETSWRVVDQGSAIELDGGFKAGLLYECVYEGKNGIVSGLGFAAVRDFVAFAKHGGASADDLGRPKRAIGFGVSQTGRFLRQFLYEGFNADESGRRVFDGVWADIGGAGRGNFNYRYAQPSRDGNAWSNVFYPTDVFPFHDRSTTDAATGKKDGLLAAAEKLQVVPKIFYTNTSYEYWGRVAALIHCTPDGREDEPLATNTRVYMVAGGQHFPGRVPPMVAASRYPGVPTNVWPVQRALLDALHRWVRDETLPPESLYPKIREGTLVAPEDRFLPPVAGLEKPRYPRLARRLDFGTEFERSGVLMAETVTVRGAFPLRVPAADADGNDQGGIQLPIVAVPLGTILPWNFRSNSGTQHMAHMIGSFVPFSRTTVEREARNDPRRAVEERYADKNAYLRRVRAAAASLVSQRFLLEADIERVVRDCDRLWEYVFTQP